MTRWPEAGTGLLQWAGRQITRPAQHQVRFYNTGATQQGRKLRITEDIDWDVKGDWRHCCVINQPETRDCSCIAVQLGGSGSESGSEAAGSYTPRLRCWIRSRLRFRGRRVNNMQQISNRNRFRVRKFKKNLQEQPPKAGQGQGVWCLHRSALSGSSSRCLSWIRTGCRIRCWIRYTLRERLVHPNDYTPKHKVSVEPIMFDVR